MSAFPARIPGMSSAAFIAAALPQFGIDLLYVSQACVHLREPPAVRERIRCDIEDTHDVGTGKVKLPIAARQPGADRQVIH